MILDIFIVSFFHNLGVDSAMDIINNETEDRIMSSRSVILPSLGMSSFGLLSCFAREIQLED